MVQAYFFVLFRKKSQKPLRTAKSRTGQSIMGLGGKGAGAASRLGHQMCNHIVALNNFNHFAGLNMCTNTWYKRRNFLMQDIFLVRRNECRFWVFQPCASVYVTNIVGCTVKPLSPLKQFGVRNRQTPPPARSLSQSRSFVRITWWPSPGLKEASRVAFAQCKPSSRYRCISTCRGFRA